MNHIPKILPQDAHNVTLVANVHPPDWTNPEPASRYNLVVIGAGTAGLVAAAGAAGLGAKVALVERHLMGGDCLNVGCVPSKSILHSSRVSAIVKDAGKFGLQNPEKASIDFSSVMERMRRLRARISFHDSVRRFQELGVDVFLGTGRFLSSEAVEVGGRTLRFKKAVIATGTRPSDPSIPGLAEAGFLTNETVFSLTERPSRLAVLGGGPIGSELAQAFRRLGSEVTLYHRAAHILNREDSDAAEIIQQAFLREGIHLILNCRVKRVEMKRGEKVTYFECQGKQEAVAVDEILVAIGRSPNLEGLNLDAVGVKHDPKDGVKVNDHLQTTNPRIYAAGDICLKYKFTHAADATARMVIQNALFQGSQKLSAMTIPWCTYTDPEIAHVGMYERDAKEQGIAVETFVRNMKDVDRAITDGEEDGFLKVHIRKGTDKVLGATLVAPHAGEMISELTLAMVGKVGLKALSKVIHCYPTQAEVIKQVADAYNRTRLTPFIKGLFARWLAWRR